MRYTVTKQIIQVIGTLWMPGVTAATELTLSPHDMEHLGDANSREAVEAWVDAHSGDFSQVLDFRADFTIGDRDIVHEWKTEESELTFNNCLYPPEE